MKFEWDEAKRRINLTRHGIDFGLAPQIFGGLTDTVVDDRFNYGEKRFLTFGFLREQVVVIAHTERNKIIRIISMRKATRNEEIAFFKKIFD